MHPLARRAALATLAVLGLVLGAGPARAARAVPAPAAASEATLRRPARAGARAPLVVAHRGGAALAPENTLGAFANAIRLGAEWVECDVHLSRDSAVVVMHDPTVDRTTDGHGELRDLSLADLRALDAAAHAPGAHAREPVPTLAELLDLARGRIGVQVEIKLDARGRRDPGIERRVVDLVNARGMRSQVIVISFDVPTLREVKRIDPAITTGFLLGDDWFRDRGGDGARTLADAIGMTGADWFLPAAPPVDSALVRAAHARGVRVGVWTLDRPEDLAKWSAIGVDAITTNRPDALLRLRAGAPVDSLR